MIKSLSFFAFLSLSLLLSASANAQCTKDIECKGDRICVEGKCSAPAYSSPGQSQFFNPNQKIDAGWAQQGGYVGLVLAAIAIPLGLMSWDTNGDTLVSGGFGMGATLIAAIGGPLVFGAAKSARKNLAVTGIVGLRTGAWITYGVTLLAAGNLLVSGVILDQRVDSGWILLTTAMGATSLVMFSAESFTCASQARKLATQQEQARQANQDNFTIAPVITVARKANQEGLTPVLGLAMTF
ncbi:hypothetical protein KAI87_08665 [Myxococcota bacterium]|nr:hypothetical protein [Myxococcota bacterium]